MHTGPDLQLVSLNRLNTLLVGDIDEWNPGLVVSGAGFRAWGTPFIGGFLALRMLNQYPDWFERRLLGDHQASTLPSRIK